MELVEGRDEETEVNMEYWPVEGTENCILVKNGIMWTLSPTQGAGIDLETE